MRALTGSLAYSLLTAATLLASTPPRAQSHTESSQPGPHATQNRTRANILVMGPSDSVGILVAGVVRNRLASDTSGRPIWVIPQRDIDENLRLAGYERNAPISQGELRQLANFMRADMLVSLNVEQSAGSLRVKVSVASRSDAEAHDLAQNMVGSVDLIGDQVVQALQQDSTYRRIRRR
jgi:hypothetical protein